MRHKQYHVVLFLSIRLSEAYGVQQTNTRHKTNEDNKLPPSISAGHHHDKSAVGFSGGKHNSKGRVYRRGASFTAPLGRYAFPTIQNNLLFRTTHTLYRHYSAPHTMRSNGGRALPPGRDTTEQQKHAAVKVHQPCYYCFRRVVAYY